MKVTLGLLVVHNGDEPRSEPPKAKQLSIGVIFICICMFMADLLYRYIYTCVYIYIYTGFIYLLALLYVLQKV